MLSEPKGHILCGSPVFPWEAKRGTACRTWPVGVSKAHHGVCWLLEIMGCT